MKKLLFLLMLGIIVLSFNACKPCKPCPACPPTGEKKLQLFIGVLNPDHHPLTYKVKFNNYPGSYEITPSSVFNLKYPAGSTNDSVSVKVFAEDASGKVYDMIWYTEPLDFTQASCKDGILYKSEILLTPEPMDDPAGVPPGTTTPVPIGITQPPKSTDIP